MAPLIPLAIVHVLAPFAGLAPGDLGAPVMTMALATFALVAALDPQSRQGMWASAGAAWPTLALFVAGLAFLLWRQGLLGAAPAALGRHLGVAELLLFAALGLGGFAAAGLARGRGWRAGAQATLIGGLGASAFVTLQNLAPGARAFGTTSLGETAAIVFSLQVLFAVMVLCDAITRRRRDKTAMPMPSLSKRAILPVASGLAGANAVALSGTMWALAPLALACGAAILAWGARARGGGRALFFGVGGIALAVGLGAAAIDPRAAGQAWAAWSGLEAAALAGGWIGQGLGATAAIAGPTPLESALAALLIEIGVVGVGAFALAALSAGVGLAFAKDRERRPSRGFATALGVALFMAAGGMATAAQGGAGAMAAGALMVSLGAGLIDARVRAITSLADMRALAART